MFCLRTTGAEEEEEEEGKVVEVLVLLQVPSCERSKGKRLKQ